MHQSMSCPYKLANIVALGWANLCWGKWTPDLEYLKVASGRRLWFSQGEIKVGEGYGKASWQDRMERKRQNSFCSSSDSVLIWGWQALDLKKEKQLLKIRSQRKKFKRTKNKTKANLAGWWKDSWKNVSFILFLS